MANFENASILDVFNAATNFGNTVLSRNDKWQQEAADIELNSMKNQFSTDANDFMMKLQASNNYEDWENQLNNFMEKTVAKTGDKSNGNPYYCRNGYMAQAAKQMIEGQQVQLKAKVDQMVWNKETEHLTEAYQKNRDADRTNLLLTPQQRYDNGMKEAKTLFEGGRINESAYNKEVDRLYQQSYSDAVISSVSNVFDDAIAGNKSFNQIWSEYQKDPVTIKKLGLDGMEEAVDLSQLNASLKKSLSEDYDAKVKDLQQQNKNKLSTIYQRLEAAETESQKLAIRREGQKALAGLQGLQMDEDGRNEYAYKFRIEPAKTTKTGTGGGGSSSGSGGSGEAEKAQLWSVWEKAGEEMIVNMIMQGDVDLETAGAVLKDWYADKIDSNLVKDIQNATIDQRDLFIAERGQDEIDNLSSTVLNTVFKDPKHAEAKNKMDNLLKDISKNPDKYGDTTYTWVLMNVLDLAVSKGVDSMDPREVNQLIDKVSNSAYAEKLQKVSNTYKTDSYGMATLKNTKDRDNYFKAIIEAGENNDVVYGDSKGLHWRSEADKAEYDKAVKTMQYDFASGMGITDPSKIQVSYKKDKNGDEVPVPVFTYNGMSYYPETIKDNKGKVVDYQYRNVKNGSTMKKRDYVAPGDAQKAAIKKQRDEAAAQEKVAQHKQMDIDAKRLAEREAKFNTMKNPPKVIEAFGKNTKDRWTDDVQKGMLIQETIPEIDKEIKRIDKISNAQEKAKAAADFSSKYGINYQDWLKLNTDDKKYDYILGLK